MSDVDRTPSPQTAPRSRRPTTPRTDAHQPRPRHPDDPSRGALRALVAGVVTAIMLVAMLGVAVFAQTGKAAEGPTFLPATASCTRRLRLDLPGDQREQLMAFLGHLPGFADAASFDTKLDETIDQLLGGSDSPISWTEDIKPWFSGQVMLGLPELPPMDMTGSASGMAAATPPVVIGLGATDARRTGCGRSPSCSAAWATASPPRSTRGTTISIVANGDTADRASPRRTTSCCSATTSTELKASLDVLAGTHAQPRG